MISSVRWRPFKAGGPRPETLGGRHVRAPLLVERGERTLMEAVIQEVLEARSQLELPERKKVTLPRAPTPRKSPKKRPSKADCGFRWKAAPSGGWHITATFRGP